MGSEIDRLFDVALDLLLVFDASGRVQRLNPAVVHTLGYSERELRSQSPLAFIHPDDVQRTLGAMKRIRGGRAVIDFHNRARCKDGSYRDVSWRGVSQEDGLVFAVGRDVTEQRRGQGRLRALYELSLQFDAGSDAQFERFLEIAKRFLGLDEAFIGRVLGDTLEIRFHDPAHGKPSRVGKRVCLQDSPAVLAVEADDVVTVRYMSRSDHAERSFARGASAEAFIAVPLHVDGDLYGVLCFASATPRIKTWGVAERRLMKMLRNWASSMLLHRRAAHRLSAAEAHMRRLDALDVESGLPNWQYLRLALPREIARCRACEEPLSLVVVSGCEPLAQLEGAGADERVRYRRRAAKATRRALATAGFVCSAPQSSLLAVLPRVAAGGAEALAARIRERLHETVTSMERPAHTQVLEIEPGEGATDFLARIDGALAGLAPADEPARERERAS